MVAVLLFVGCGSSSGPTEEDAARLLDREALVSGSSCAKVEGPEFVCRAEAEGQRVTLHATVAEDGQSVVVTRCDDEESIYNPCEAVR